MAETIDASSQGLVEAALRGGLRKDENLLVVVDQFEELFRYPREKTGRAARFVERLLAASETPRASIYIVLTMRSDYLGECAQFPSLAEKLNGGQYLIPRLTRDERREAIEGPVLVAGAEITPALIEELLNDSGNEPDQLPILQHALSRIWEVWSEAPSGPLDLPLYHDPRIQSMSKALDLNASTVLAELKSDEYQRVSRLLFRRITDQASGKRDTRRPTTVREILDLTGAELATVQTIYDHFSRAGASFLYASPTGPLTPESILDISHEALISNWTILREWGRQEAEFAREYLRLADSAGAGEGFTQRTVFSYLQWEANLLGDLLANYPAGKLPPELRAKGLMDFAVKWGRLSPVFLMVFNGVFARSADMRVAVWASRYTPERKTFQAAFAHLRRQMRNAGLRWVLAYALLVGLAVAGVFWFQQRESAHSDRVRIDAQGKVVAANELFADDPVAALKSAVAAVEATDAAKQPPVYGAMEVLKRATLAIPKVVWQGHAGGVERIVWSPDSTKLASSGFDGSLRLWSVSARTPLTAENSGGTVLGWTSDGAQLLVMANRGVERWSWSPLARVDTVISVPFDVKWAAWSPVNKMLAMGNDPLVHDVVVVVWKEGSESGRTWHASHRIFNAVWHPSIPVLALRGSDTVRLMDPEGGRIGEIKPSGPPSSVAWDESGGLLAIGAEDWSARVYEIMLSPTFTYRELGYSLGPNRAGVSAVVWGPKTATADRSQLLATGSQNAKVFRISPKDGKHQRVAEFGEWQNRVDALAWSPDGMLLAVAAETKISVYALDVLDAVSQEDWLRVARGRLAGK